MTFKNQLAWGQIGEGLIAQWLNARGWTVFPAYEKETDTGKGPRLFTPGGQLVAPDMLAFSAAKRKALWVEAKSKSVFSWHRNTGGRWTTGIDVRHYEEYKRVATDSRLPVWLLFLHRESSVQGRDEPWPCPTGLFGNTLAYLENHENHRSPDWGRSGMVYWAREELKQLATLDAVLAAVKVSHG